MGAHRMNVPEELAEYKLERAELAIALPADWKLVQESMQDERWYWPIRLLKVLARLPIASDTWLGFGHTMDNKENFAENTKLCAAILTGPQSTEEGGEVCTLPGGEEVNFYQVIPLYEDELDYKLEHDVDALLNKMRGISFVVNPTRQNAITRGTLSNDDFDGEMDDASYHIESIEEKGLPIDPINAYNHILDQHQISFQYNEYTPEKKKILKHDGYRYILDPYALEWKNDHYYLIGYSHKHKGIAHFRVDRLTSVEPLDSKFQPMPDFDVAAYTNKMVDMFAAEHAEQVKLLCSNELMRVIIDHYGEDIEISPYDDTHFTVIIEVNPSGTFYGWVFKFMGKIRILSPQSCVDKMQDIARTFI